MGQQISAYGYEYFDRDDDRDDCDYHDGGDDCDCNGDHDDMGFADPGGNSALRAASPSNPRNLPCPNCEAPNRLTPRDVQLGYQCDSCADALEGGFGP